MSHAGGAIGRGRARRSPPRLGSDRDRNTGLPVDLDIVNITVTVHDKDGQLVTDLTADDFLVFEDGRPQKI